MKLFTLILFSLLNWSAFTQIIISQPANNVMYRTYDNFIQISDPSYELESESADIIKKDNGFIVQIKTNEKKVQIHAKNPKTGKIEGTFEYRVYNLPLPEIHWGDVSPENKVKNLAAPLKVAYDESIFLNDSFTVVNYELTFNGLSYKNKGYELSEKLVEAVKAAKQRNGGEDLYINVLVTYRGHDGIERKKGGVFLH